MPSSATSDPADITTPPLSAVAATQLEQAGGSAPAGSNPYPAEESPVDARVVPARILIVEDELLVALDIQLRLEKMWHAAVVVSSGEEAVRKCSETPFDLVLMDIRLGGALDGIEAARAIRNERDLPIVYLTSHSDRDTIERARSTEPYGYLLKPFHERELGAVIEMALQRHRADMRRWEQQELHRFLADASARLAGSLDYRAVASRAMDLLVPRYADWCTIWLEGIEDLSPGVVYTRPGELEPGRGHATPVIETLLRTRRSELVRQVSDESLSDALGAHNMVALRACGARSLIGVPLIAGDRLVGALVLVAGDTRPRYGANDRLFVEDFGHRLGVAIDNALLYRKAELATRAREDMLAIVSHDLRTPLAMILGDAEVVSSKPELRKVGERIARGVRRMTRLIGDLVDAAAIDAGKLTVQSEVVAVAPLLGEAVEMFSADAKRREIELVTELPPEAAFIACDRDRILQVLSNLIGNAITFTQPGGTVTVRAEREPTGIRLEVRDTGCGIPSDQVPHLFERYWRARARRTGAGLGLFISGGIVTAHGSTLDVETASGQGSRFSFVLPEARQALDDAP